MPENSHLRILIIDDNPAIHSDFTKILSTDSPTDDLNKFEKALFGKEIKKPETHLPLPHFYIDSASQGKEGVEKISKAMKENNPYALAFVDIRMPPGWDGVETIKHIWHLDPDMQIVICTAYSDYTWEETVEELGQKENLLILKKPFDHISVRQLSLALTKKWELLRESRDYTRQLEERVKERTFSLQQSLSITRGTLESSVDGILVVNNINKIIDYNNKFIEMWHVDESTINTGDPNKIF